MGQFVRVCIQLFCFLVLIVSSWFVSNILVYREIIPHYICVCINLVFLFVCFIVLRSIKFSVVSVFLLFLLLFVGGYSDFTQVYVKVLFCVWLVVFAIENGCLNLLDKNKLSFFCVVFLGFEFLLGVYQIVCQSFHGMDGFYITGTFDNPIGYASTLLFAVPFVLFYLDEKKKIGYIITFVLGGMLVFVGSRACLLALVGVLFIHFLLYSRVVVKVPKHFLLFFVVLVLIALFCWKIDSFNGRLLIWEGVWNMICDNPWGYGVGGFEREYMDYQASLLQGKGEYWQQLADDVFHPFNEFLKIAVEFGVPVFLCVCFCVLRFLLNLCRDITPKKILCLELLVGLLLVASFSYPLNYPITWYVIGITIGLVYNGRLREIFLTRYFRCILSILVVMISVLLFNLMGHYYAWKKMLDYNYEETVNIESYSNLYPMLKCDVRFVYAYAALLNNNRNYTKSVFYLHKVLDRLNSYEIQLLMADNYRNLSLYDLEEKYLRNAKAMCPNRFLPLYYLVKLYDRNGDKNKALQLAKEILEKDVKVQSLAVHKIKSEMYDYFYSE